MSLDLLLQSIASSGQAIIKNVKSYDLKLQEVPSLLTGAHNPEVPTLKRCFLTLTLTRFHAKLRQYLQRIHAQTRVP
jgi:hypothetical protein